jgi:hypothetical protein
MMGSRFKACHPMHLSSGAVAEGWQRVQSSKFKGICRLLLACLLFVAFCLSSLNHWSLSYAGEYTFDASEVEKKPYQIGGYLEFSSSLMGLDRNASLYKLNFYDRKTGATTEQYKAGVQLEGSLEKGIARLYAKTYTNYTNSIQGETTKLNILEGYGSLKPSSSLTFDFGKKTLNWGKGYAWNPAAFLDRPKDPNDPELSREGFIVASADYTKSFTGPFKTFSFTPVLVPAYSGVNDDFGEIDHLNGAAKLYFLLYDTDIDLMFLTGGSRTTRYGFDFSRNITTNLELHGEFSLINGYQKRYSDSNGIVKETTYNAKNYLIGLRYLTEQDTTFILEYYRNGTGFSAGEMKDYFSFIDKAYNRYITKGNASQLDRAEALIQGGYGRTNPAKNYLYFRVSQKEPFDLLYFTPAVTLIANVDDKSFSITPEVMYTGITNLELRLTTGIISGTRGSEYGEKQNDYRMEFRARYYF